MTEADVEKDLIWLRKTLAKAGLLLESSALVWQTLGQGRKRLSWTDRPAAHLDRGTLREVLDAFDSRAWMLRMVDKTALQLSWEFEHGSLIKHRYAALPWPFVTDEAERKLIDEFGLNEWLDASLLAMAPSVVVGGCVRVDFDAKAASESHPAVHLTLFGPSSGHAHGRLAISRPWLATQFARFWLEAVCPAPDGVDKGVLCELAARTTALPPLITNGQKTGPWLAWGRAG